MATPDFVKFSRIPGDAAGVLKRLEAQVLPRYELEYERFGALGIPADPKTFAYTGGLDLVGEMVPCTTAEEALSMGHDREAWAISFLVRRPRARIHLYLYAFQKESLGAALSIDTSLITYEAEDLPPGEWLRGFLLSTVSAFGCQVEGYGADNAYQVGYVPLDPAVVVSRVRSGEVFTKRYPSFHSISVDLIAPEEMDALLETFPKNMFLRYALSTTGYHVLSVLTPRKA